MRSTLVFVSAVLLVVFVASSVDAKSDGSMGSDCASCHANGIPGQKPKDPPVTEPPVTEPPVTDPPVAEPPVTEPPIVEPAVVLQGVEITTIWDYNIVEGQADLDYVFYTVIETDNTVNFVEIITPSGTVLQLTQEPETQLDNIITRFTDEGDTFVWQCEARFDDIEQLAAYGKGKFTIATVTDEAVTDTIIQYHPPKAKVKKPKHQKNKAHKDHAHFEDSGEQDEVDEEEDDGDDD